MLDSRYLIPSTASVTDALARLNTLPGGSLTLFVVDSDGRLCGTLTDGDIRRALLRGVTLDNAVDAAMQKNFRAILRGSADVDAVRRWRARGIRLIPVLDADGTVVDIVNLNTVHNILPLSAVLMAGGKGERLRPATLTTPKPLLEIEGKAIIDYNIESLAACGIDDITVTTRYLAEKIEQHFAAPVAGVAVKTVREEVPLGTIGAVALTGVATNTAGDTLVMNSDLLTTIPFEDMYMTHKERNADVTIAVVPYQVSVPYAIVAFDDDDNTRITAIEEKPSYSYYANAGIYIFSNKILAMLDGKERCDATDLVERAIAAGYKVTHYIIKGTWIDVGSPVDFRQASELMRHHNSMAGSNR